MLFKRLEKIHAEKNPSEAGILNLGPTLYLHWTCISEWERDLHCTYIEHVLVNGI